MPLCKLVFPGRPRLCCRVWAWWTKKSITSRSFVRHASATWLAICLVLSCALLAVLANTELSSHVAISCSRPSGGFCLEGRAQSRIPHTYYPPKTLGNPCGIPKVPCHVACSALIIVNATEVWHHCDAVCAFVSVVTLEALAVGALKVDAAYF